MSILRVDQIQHSNGTAALTIDSSGRVLSPKVPHIFGSITNTTTQNSFASSMNVVSSTELTFSSSRITVPTNGIYLITFTSISNLSSVRTDANIFVNGVARINMLSEDTTTGYHYRSASLTIKLLANDYIQFFHFYY